MIWFIINEIAELSAAQTTAILIHRMAQRGHAVAVCAIGTLHVDASGEVFGRARRAAVVDTPQALVQGLKAGADEVLPITAGDAVWIRTNPGRYAAQSVHRSALAMLDLADRRGARILNRPAGLQRAETKLYLHCLPEQVRPTTLVAHRPEALRGFVDAAEGPVVLKPLSGTRGTDVFRLGPGADNINQIIDVLSRQGAVMAQGFVPEAVDGDVRVLLIDGRPLTVDGQVAAVRRRPPKGDFRSNVYRGGAAEAVTSVPGLEPIIDAIGDQLRADGLFFVGLDLIGTKIVEVNVFSPGGVADMEIFNGVDYTTPLLDAFEAAAGC